MIKASQLTLKRSDSFLRVVSTITGDDLGIELKQRLLRCKVEDLKLAFQHCGGSMKELPDQKKGSIADALSLQDVLLEALNTKTGTSDNNNNNNNESDGTNKTDKKDASVESSVIEEKDVVDTKSDMLKWFMSRD